MTNLGHFSLKGFIIYVVENLWEKIPNIIIILPKIRIWGKKKKHWSYKSIVSGRKMAKLRHPKIPLEIGAPNKWLFWTILRKKPKKRKLINWYFSVFLVKIGLPNFPNFWGNIWTNFWYNTKIEKKVPWAAQNSSLFFSGYILLKSEIKNKLKLLKSKCFLRFSIARIRI
jgi:hypothetical protein